MGPLLANGRRLFKPPRSAERPPTWHCRTKRKEITPWWDLPATRATADRAAAELGGIDILFANAGIQAFKPFPEWEDADWHDQDWHDQLDVSLTGAGKAHAVVFLASDEARVVSGTTYDMTVGDSAHYSA